MRLRLGTRKSKLALVQAEKVAALIKTHHPGIMVDIVPITTTGDRLRKSPLFNVGGKGLFIKEIEDALLNHEVDFAVHSMKDVPAILPPPFIIPATLKRDSPFDAFIPKIHGTPLNDTSIRVIGTASVRRKAQLLHQFKSISVVSLRGNVDTRLRKLS